MKHYLVLVWQLGAYALVVAVGVVSLWRLHDAQLRSCRATEDVKRYLFQAIERYEKTLPTLTYYKQHPLELRNALETIRREKSDFAARPC